MAAGAPGVDELIREYLIFRGFTNTLRTFETEIKNDKDKNFRADRIVEQLQSHVHSFDIAAVRNLWQYLDRRFFARLEQTFVPTVRRLETCLLRYYLVHCVTANRADRVTDFFERYASELQLYPDWRDWFALPYVRTPEQDKMFSMYFHRTWSDTFLLSLYNFLSVIFDSMPLPSLLQYCDDQRRLHKLSEEVEGLRHELHMLHSQQQLMSMDMENQQTAVSKRASYTRKQAVALPVSGVADPKATIGSSGASLSEAKEADAPSQPASAKMSTPSGVLQCERKSTAIASVSTAGTASVATAAPEDKPVDGVNKSDPLLPASPLAIRDDFFPPSEKSPVATRSLRAVASAGDSADHTDGPVNVSSTQPSPMPITDSNNPSVVLPQGAPDQSLPTTTAINTTPTTSLGRPRSSAFPLPTNDAGIGDGSTTPSRKRTATQPTPSTHTTPGVFIPGISNKPSSTTLPRSFRSPTSSSTGISEDKGMTGSSSAALTGSRGTSSATLEKTQSADDNMLRGSQAVTEEDSAFIFLSEEAFTEHRASITNCRFAPGGSSVASCDIEGVVKIWTSNPCRTISTVMSKTPVMTFDWLSSSTAASNVLLLGYGNGRVRLYDINTKSHASEFEASSEHPRVVSLASNPSGSIIAVGSANAATSASLGYEQQAANLASGAAQPPTHAPGKSRLSLTRFFSSSSSSSSVGVDTSNGQLALWEANTLKMQMILTLDPAPTCINTLRFNRNGTLLACGSADGMIRIFDIATGDCIVGWHAHMGQVYSISFTHDENSLYSLGHDGKFNQWSIRQVAQKINEVPLDTASIGGLQTAVAAGPLTYSPYNNLFRLDSDSEHVLTSSGANGMIYQLSDSATNPTARKVVTLRAHPAPITGIDWNAALSCGTCLTTAQDGSIYVSTLLKQ